MTVLALFKPSRSKQLLDERSADLNRRQSTIEAIEQELETRTQEVEAKEREAEQRQKQLDAYSKKLEVEQKALNDLSIELDRKKCEYEKRRKQLAIDESALNKLSVDLDRKKLADIHRQERFDAEKKAFAGTVASLQMRTPLAPTFDPTLFSDTLLAQALINYDYDTNPRLFSALSQDISFRRQAGAFSFSAFSRSSRRTYTVTLDSCTCEDFEVRKVVCKHMYALAVALGWVSQSRERQIDYKLQQLDAAGKTLETKLARMRVESEKLEKKSERIKQELSARDKVVQEHELQLRGLIKNTFSTFPAIAEAAADIQYSLDKSIAHDLRRRQPPAKKAADEVNKIARSKRQLLREFKLLRYTVSMYEQAAPWLRDSQMPVQELAEALDELESNSVEEYQTLRNYLSPEEYQQLTTAEKYQLALDRYKKHPKSNWKAGVEYERYVGYLFESQGYHVYYSGALKGKEDLGRDLVASRGDDVFIIQCKRWAKEKLIREKHVFQLFGSAFEYRMAHPDKNVRAVLVSTCPLSELAALYASALDVLCVDQPFDVDFPRVKCNIGSKGRIYHLPFDQQYDHIVIDISTGEFYAETVQQAEDAGFVRARRWKPPQRKS